MNDGKGLYLTTEKDYGDFELWVDYKMLPVKLTAKKATMRSDDGTVLLNHIRVQPKDRIKWQIVKEEDGNYKLFFETQDQVEITSVTLKINRFLQSREKLGIYNKLSYTPVGLEFNLDAKQLEAFSKDLTEGHVAEDRKDTNKDLVIK